MGCSPILGWDQHGEQRVVLTMLILVLSAPAAAGPTRSRAETLAMQRAYTEAERRCKRIAAGQSAAWGVPQLGACASSGFAGRLWVARYSQSLPRVLELAASVTPQFNRL